MPQLSVLGLMSGSSLDGVDLGWCAFNFSDEYPGVLLDWQLRAGRTLPYSATWTERLRQAPELSGRELWQLHTDLGHYYGQVCQDFLAENGAEVDCVASHGHTVFHFPQQRTTTQVGDAAAMAAILGLPVIDQFRTQDMALGGQGAPLAPLADKYLFHQYWGNLNLGGIANISVRTSAGYIACDIGGANQVLDALVAEIGLPYDDEGQLARSGQLLPDLLAQANALPYFHAPSPKSLGNDWVQEQLLPLFQNKDQQLADRLHTFCVHCAEQIGRSVQQITTQYELATTSDDQIMVAGGGGFNTFLCECIGQQIAPRQLSIPTGDIVAYKEAALLALAGALRWLELPNVLPAATGARRASVGGAVHWGA
ncbi:MAG: anhydro-N-acetylmuramic acid kinase [Bacteroidota bacterium]